MMFFRIILLLISLSFSMVWAQETRWVDIEWDKVQDAQEYEIELFETVKKQEFPRGKFKVEEPRWSHSVPPGKYSIRLRSIDERGVPGEWSEQIPLKVKVLKPLLIRPSLGERFTEPLVYFEWLPSQNAEGYHLIIKNSDQKVIHDLKVKSTSENIEIKDLGTFSWTIVPLEEDGETGNIDSIPPEAFRTFERVGDQLEAPVIQVDISDKVELAWDKVGDATSYEIDYIPPTDSKEKIRKFKVSRLSFSFSKSKLKQGVTTLTVKSLAKNHLDSKKTLVKLARINNDVQIQEITNSKVQTGISPIFPYWRNQLFTSLLIANSNYRSKNIETDTRLEQDELGGFGVNLEWIFQKNTFARKHKIETSFISLKTGATGEDQTRLAYSYMASFLSATKSWTFGAGASYLGLPAFLGNMFTNEIMTQKSQSIGPEITIGVIDPLTLNWHLHGDLVYAYHSILFGDSIQKDGFSWVKAQVRLLYNYSPKMAFFVGGDYQHWSQGGERFSSTLNGWSWILGFKNNWQ